MEKEIPKPGTTGSSGKAAEAKPKTAERSLPPKAKTETAVQGRLSIQVASVKDRKAADAMVAKLLKKGYRARRVMGKVPGKGIWYRVRIGYFEKKGDAAETLRRLEKDRYKGMLVNN